jgi:hypothetical protein
MSVVPRLRNAGFIIVNEYKPEKKSLIKKEYKRVLKIIFKVIVLVYVIGTKGFKHNFIS